MSDVYMDIASGEVEISDSAGVIEIFELPNDVIELVGSSNESA